MNITEIKLKLLKLFKEWSGIDAIDFIPLPLSGSDRRYFRLVNNETSAIAVYNANLQENTAFYSFTESFLSLGLRVPKIYAADLGENIYLLEDLGDVTLLQRLDKERALAAIKDNRFPDTMWEDYKKALEQLAYMQIKGTSLIDYKCCYPTAVFNEQSMLWDCNQFKYWYLQPSKCVFNEVDLEADFRTLCAYLHQADSSYFMFRDFQARNIMLKEDQLYFIDYQGGRRGPLQYDVASLLFQAKAQLPNEVRTSLLEHYIKTAKRFIDLDESAFRNYYYGYVLLRCMQVLGAYGFKGYYQQKSHFLSSIPFALDNLRWLLETVQLPIDIPYLYSILERISQDNPTEKLGNKETLVPTLNLHIQSFSYHKGDLENHSGHGIGYVFDCRLIHNPGRYEAYKSLSGLDAEVKKFFEREMDMFEFLEPVLAILDKAVSKYVERGFTDLGINFGCTGGQHRSVYAAESTAHYLKKRFAHKVVINLKHREQNSWKQ